MTDTVLHSETTFAAAYVYNGAEQSSVARLDAAKRSVCGLHSKETASVSRRQRKIAAVSNPQNTRSDVQEEDELELKRENNTVHQWWGKTTNDLVQLSTFPFLFLSIPQVLQNAVNLSNGNVAALSILSWKGFMTALAGNSILLSYFVKKRESGAAVVQAIGVMSNFLLLVQIYMAGLLNVGLLAGIAAFILLSCFVNGTVVLGATQSWNWLQVEVINRLWETFLSVLGLSLLVHALWTTAFPKATLLPALVTSVVSLIIDIMHWKDKLNMGMKRAWSGISAWTATCLFAFQPIGQLVCNFEDPSSLAGLSLNTILLAMIGNGLMVPRALHTRDKIWLTGTLWSSLMMGWAQLLCLYVGGLQTGSCYLTAGLFYFLSFCAASYFFLIFTLEAKSSKLRYPLESVLLTYLSH